jgi:hypothetical protein
MRSRNEGFSQAGVFLDFSAARQPRNLTSIELSTRFVFRFILLLTPLICANLLPAVRQAIVPARGKGGHTRPGVLSMSLPWLFLEEQIREEATVFELPAKETQDWIVAWKAAYRLLEMSDEDVRTLDVLLRRIRWGFSAVEIENLSRKERYCLSWFRHILVSNANRIFGNKPRMDPHAASYLGGRPSKIRLEDYESIRTRLKELRREGKSKTEAIKLIRDERKLKASVKTLERICQNRAFGP